MDGTNKYFGDMQYLQRGNPMGTVFGKEVAWHGLDNGRAVFMYPAGTMSQKEIDEKQRNLNDQQKKFYKK